MKKPRKPEDQVKAFRKAARELECEDNEDRFKEALRTVAKKKVTAPAGRGGKEKKPAP